MFKRIVENRLFKMNDNRAFDFSGKQFLQVEIAELINQRDIAMLTILNLTRYPWRVVGST